MHLRTLFVVYVLSLASGQDRKVTPKLNPDCESCSENTTLVYIRADGSHDTVHQLWDFTRGTPTVIYAVTGLNSSLTVSWARDRPVNFTMTEEPKYSFAMTISELIEYNDLEDFGKMDSRSESRSYPLHELVWSRRDSVLTEQEAMLQMHADRFERNGRWRNGSIDVKLDLIPFRDYSVDLPHLIHTANSSLIDVQLLNLTTSRDFNSSRFALRLVLVSTDDAKSSMVQKMKKSLDDEHTPGVFEIIEIKTPMCVAGGAGGFLQFRPVAYTQPERSVTSSTVVHASAFNRTSIPRRSTLSAFYGDPATSALLVQAVAVSFGEPGDGFYAQHNYTAWSTSFGYGAPPVETFSLFVVLVMCVGLGAPVLLAASGVLLVLARRRRAHVRLREH